MTDDDLLGVLDEAVGVVRRALDALPDWAPRGRRAGQYNLDIVADDAVVAPLVEHGLGVLSEESGAHHTDREIVVVIDPVDGSTNASRRIPWYATSVCAVDKDGPRAALVVNQASGERFQAVRGRGATCDGAAIQPSECATLADAVIGIAGLPSGPFGARQSRALGAAALDICYVAAGRLDGYLACTSNPLHGPWDYLGALLVCREAGAVVEDVRGLSLDVVDWDARRSPVAAATPTLLTDLVAAFEANE